MEANRIYITGTPAEVTYALVFPFIEGNIDWESMELIQPFLKDENYIVEFQKKGMAIITYLLSPAYFYKLSNRVDELVFGELSRTVESKVCHS
jgi:hypothetical protein